MIRTDHKTISIHLNTFFRLNKYMPKSNMQWTEIDEIEKKDKDYL